MMSSEFSSANSNGLKPYYGVILMDNSHILRTPLSPFPPPQKNKLIENKQHVIYYTTRNRES